MFLNQPLANLYEHLSNGLENIARSPRTEIPKIQEDMRLSLAGAQQKILHRKFLLLYSTISYGITI